MIDSLAGPMFGDGSGAAILLLGFLLGARFVERQETVSRARGIILVILSGRASHTDELSLILDAEKSAFTVSVTVNLVCPVTNWPHGLPVIVSKTAEKQAPNWATYRIIPCDTQF